MFQSLVYSVLTLVSGVVLSTTSCMTVINTPPSGGNNNGGGSTEKITVRFINSSPFALDPQSADPVITHYRTQGLLQGAIPAAA